MGNKKTSLQTCSAEASFSALIVIGYMDKGAVNVERLAEWVWGMPMLLLLLAAGMMVTLTTRVIQVQKLGASIRLAAGGLGGRGRSSFQAVCTALAGTVGTGNIAGVAGAIALGGPGAVFWMWVSAFFGMAVKYAEVVLAMKYRQRQPDGAWTGGAMYQIRFGMGPRWKPMAAAFAMFAILASLGMGNMVQVHTIAAMVTELFPHGQSVPLSLAVGLATALLVLFLSGGRGQRLGAVMAYLVPVLAGAYILGAMAVIVVHAGQIGPVLGQIVQGAVSPKAVLGGGAGIGLRQTIRWGVSRGVFSNEAGLGSAPMAHAGADAEPEIQGLFGIFEVFLDTVVLCTLTALAILVSGVPIAYGKPAGAELASAALATAFGKAAPGMLACCLGLLALATVLSWQLYGAMCAQYLWGNRGIQIYRLVHVAVILLGATMELSQVWALSDVCNGLMCLPNLISLAVLWPKRQENHPAKQTASYIDFPEQKTL